MSDETEMLRRIAIANSETANLLLRIASMQAENAMRELNGESPAYGEKEFLAEGNNNYISNLLQL